MFSWFRRSKNEANTALTMRVRVLEDTVELLKTALEEQKMEFRAFRGRIYGWKLNKLAPEPSTEPQAGNLNDPRLSKQELRQRLAQEGRLRPVPDDHKPT